MKNASHAFVRHWGEPVTCTIKVLKVRRISTYRLGEPVVMARGCDVIVMWQRDGIDMVEPVDGICVPDPDVAPGRCYYADLDSRGKILNWKIPKRRFA